MKSAFLAKIIGLFVVVVVSGCYITAFDDCLESALASSCIALHCITGAEAMNAYQEVKEWYDAKRTKGHYKPEGFCYFGK